MATVHFLDINFDGLKATIIEHCSIWQQKLTALLLRMTDTMVDHVYHYIAENSTKLVACTNCYLKQKEERSKFKKSDMERGLLKQNVLYFIDFYLYIR